MRRKTDESGCSGFERSQSGAPGKLSAGRGHRDCVRRSQRSGHLRKRIRPISWTQADGVSSGIFRHHRTIHAGRLRRRIVPKFPAILPKNARQSTKDCLRFLVVSQKIFWHAPPPGMIRCCLKIRALRSAETEHHHHRERGSGAGLLGWRFPRNEICNQAMQKPEYSGESVCPFPFRLTSLHRQSNIQPYCPEPVEYPQAPFFCSQRKKGFLTEEQSILCPCRGERIPQQCC